MKNRCFYYGFWRFLHSIIIKNTSKIHSRKRTLPNFEKSCIFDDSMCVAQTAAPEGGSNNVSELSNGFPAVINALGGVSVLTKKAFANLLQGPKVKEKLVKTKAKSSQNGAKSHKNAPPRVTRRLWREKPWFVGQNVEPKWSQNGAKMDPKTSKNQVRKRTDFRPRFFIDFEWFLGGKSGQKSSKIDPQRRSKAKTYIFRKC